MRFHLSLIFVVLVLLRRPLGGRLRRLSPPSTGYSRARRRSDTITPEVLARVSAGPGARPPAPAGRGRKAVTIALRFLGLPYRWGGASPAGFDCSGLVMYAYGRVGIALPHNGAMLWRKGRAVQRGNLEPGDVVFFDGLGHVGIFIGRGRSFVAP